MTITAKNVGRIDVWPSTTNALDADTSESKVLQRMTIWPSSAQARANVTVTDVGQGGVSNELREDGGAELREDSGQELREAA